MADRGAGSQGESKACAVEREGLGVREGWRAWVGGRRGGKVVMRGEHPSAAVVRRRVSFALGYSSVLWQYTRCAHRPSLSNKASGLLFSRAGPHISSPNPAGTSPTPPTMYCVSSLWYETCTVRRNRARDLTRDVEASILSSRSEQGEGWAAPSALGCSA
jgi:hypothetical protein